MIVAKSDFRWHLRKKGFISVTAGDRLDHLASPEEIRSMLLGGYAIETQEKMQTASPENKMFKNKFSNKTRR